MKPKQKFLLIAVLLFQLMCVFIQQRWFDDGHPHLLLSLLVFLLPGIAYIWIGYRAPMFGGLVPFLRLLCLIPLVWFLSQMLILFFGIILMEFFGIGHWR
jgi:hypothetical membrane protein